MRKLASALLLVGVLAASGCASNPGPASPGATTATPPVSTPAPSAQAPDVPPTPTTGATTFSPADISVRQVERGKTTTTVRVVAPAATRFALGDSAPGRSCSTVSATGADPVTYVLTCPGRERHLFATIAYGDFDYGFQTVLP